jgi:osmotically-inducible protein OsmY
MRSITSIAFALALVACEKKEPPAADNTERNERDRAVSALTPLDQGESEADRSITQRARQRVVEQYGLSVNGQNVKIITQDGVVTLRGPVDSQQEKQSIVQSVTNIDGVRRVNDQLEIAGGNKSASALPDRPNRDDDKR